MVTYRQLETPDSSKMRASTAQMPRTASAAGIDY